MAHLTIRLLGPFEVTLDGEPVTQFETLKTRALLAYLAAEADSQHLREALAEMLWPDRPEGAARANLRHTLRSLRLAIGDYEAGPPFLITTREAIALNPDGDAWVDVRAFAGSLLGLERMQVPDPEALEEALSLCRGTFLEGLSLPDSALFEEWRILKREQVQRKALDLLSRLVAGYEGRGDFERALAFAWRKVDLEPWDETAHRQVMRLLARSGRRAEALAQYEACRHLLVQELDVDPAAETMRLYEQIQRGELGPGSVPVPTWDLPASPTPFFGRTRELAILEERLADPDTRLVTITGPGGSGKTRLALEAGTRLAKQDRLALAEGIRPAVSDGAVFVSLAAVDTAEGLMPALSDALGLRLQGGKEQLIEALRRRRVLLILDNLEHLLAGVELLAEILRAAPGIQILATSRERLQLRGEHVLALGGLDYPDHEASRHLPDAAGMDTYLAAYPALQLFLDSARRVQPSLALATEDLPVMLEICRRVDGLPLALELVASWADTLSLDEILVETRQSLGFLQAEWRDAPERQHSMRAVFDVSWRQLAEAEQAAFSQLSVFRGGFTRQAATQAVMGTEAASRLLAALVRKSFLQHDQASHRYQIHELLRQYGAEKLASDPAAESAARGRHSRHYCDWLGQAGEGLKHTAPQAVWDAIQADIENVRAACLWAASHGHPNRLAPAVNALGWFYYLGYGNYQQGENTFRLLRQALTEAESEPSPASAAQRATIRILAWQATMWSLLGDLETSWRLIHEAQALLDGPILAGQDTRLERAILAYQSGYGRMYADPEAGRQHFAESLELYQQVGHKLGMAYALMGLGRAASRLHMADEVRETATRGISLQQETDNLIGLSEALVTLGGWTAGQMQFREGEDLIRQGLSLTPQTNLFGTAFGLGLLGQVQLQTGRFAEAAATASDCMTIFEDIGWRLWAIRRSIILARARLHAGEYAAAGAEAEATISAAQEVDWGRGVGYAQVVLAEVALVEGGFAQAYRLLQDSLYHVREYANQPWDVHHSTWLGLAARGLERRDEAWRHLASALERAGKGPHFLELMTVLAGIALLLADEAQIERAVELYALASRYPFVAKSRWFADVVGKRIAAAADTLPAERVAVLEQGGETRDLEATVAELLAELCE